MTFIILGYALVATSIDICNKAVTFRSENSAYGNRSRLVYIAELRAFRRLFDQRWTVMQYCAALLFLTSTVVVFLFAAVEIRTAGEYYSSGILGGVVALLLIFLFVSIMANVSHMTYYSFVENWSHRLWRDPMQMPSCKLPGETLLSSNGKTDAFRCGH